jgi:plastocyanin
MKVRVGVMAALVATAAASCGDDTAPRRDLGTIADRGTGGGDKGTAVVDKGSTGGDKGAAAGCAAGFAGCSTFTAGTTVSFSGGGFAYTPKCLRVKAGTAVTFNGSFSFHPLAQACGPASEITATSSGSSASFLFKAPGLYAYYCTAHGSATGTGMAGAIEVEP